ncbi:MAG TPA: GNAT family N-acetyltransferase [Pseudorhodoplanes sp.]|nr:GNAT family N-acetyltransferase [Pseudorhodoplanes sp.]
MDAPIPDRLPSADLIRRTVDIEAKYTISRLRVLERIAGNPIGVAVRRAGKNGWCLMARHLPVPSFNAVVGLAAGDENELPAIAQWYRDKDIKFQIEIVPGLESAALLRGLAELGLHHSGFHVSMIARPQDAKAPDPAIDVQRVTDEAAFEDFLDAYIAGWKIPDGAGFKRNVRPWLGLPGWSLFVGRIGGKPAAEAIAYLDGDFCYLADASTDPAFRNRGLQTALLAHRLQHAAKAGVKFACSGAAFGSASHRNMARAGMTLQFVRALWTRL